MPFRHCGGRASGRQAYAGAVHAAPSQGEQLLFLIRHHTGLLMPAMIARLSWAVWGLVALAAMGLLVRNVLAIAVLAPLDPNEGWNAAHALSLMTNGALYPPPGSLMINNYPPLSFYAVGMVGMLTGDMVIAGRLLSLLSFLLVCGAIALVCKQMACGTPARLCAALFFAALLLIGSDYVAMDDPQLLGHA